MHVARGAAAQIFHVGGGAQRAVLQFLVLLEKAQKRLVVALDRALGLAGSRFRSLVLIGRAFVSCLVAHGVFPSVQQSFDCAGYRCSRSKNQEASASGGRPASRFAINSNFTLTAASSCGWK
jgi:hypothetical protein